MPRSTGMGGAVAAQSAVEQELERFSYIVSHDLAASFRHVSEFSRLLLAELGDGLTGRQQSHADHILAATDKCQMMMEQLLLFSRVQQKTLDPTRQDATQAMRLAVMQFGVAEGAGAEVTVEPLGEMFGDAELLALVFSRLLENAVKFRRPETPSRVSVRAGGDRRFWRMRIVDTGIGVAAAHRDKAFQMFQRLNGEGVYPGVGAGLAMCRRIARRHGGDVTFLDCVDGACVELALPRAPTLQ